MNSTDFTSVFKEALLSTPKTSSSMQPEDFLGHLFTTDKQIAAKTASDFYSGGNLAVRNSWSFDVQALPCFLLLYTMAGCGKLLMNQHVISLTENSLLLLNCRQRFRIDVAVSPWKYQVLFFDNVRAAEMLSLITKEPFCILNATAHSEYVLHLEKLLCLNYEKTMISQLRASDLLNHLLTEFTIEFLKKDQEFRKIPSYIEKIHDLFEEHYEENYSLDDLEARFSISKYRICREFGEYYGITPLQYLNRRRIVSPATCSKPRPCVFTRSAVQSASTTRITLSPYLKNMRAVLRSNIKQGNRGHSHRFPYRFPIVSFL